MSDENNNMQAVIDAARAGYGVLSVIPDKGAPVVLLPDGCTVKVLDQSELEKHLPAPLRKRGTFQFADAESFSRYFVDHKSLNAVIFASVTDDAANFSGVMNFHGANPSWNDHKATFSLRQTQEWKRWIASNKKAMAQGEFATFLEENADLFVKPSGADLLELITDLEGHSNVNINSGIRNLASGSIRVEYDEEVTLKGGGQTSKAGAMDIPAVLELAIAPFEGVAPAAIRARLRYRIAERKITFWYETIDAHKVVRSVCDSVLKQIAEKTGVQPLMV